MTWLKDMIVKYALKKYALGWAVALWGKAEGYRTQVQMVVAIGILVAGLMNVIAWDKAIELAGVIGGAAIATFLEKLKRYESQINTVKGVIAEEISKKQSDKSAEPEKS